MIRHLCVPRLPRLTVRSLLELVLLVNLCAACVALSPGIATRSLPMGSALTSGHGDGHPEVGSTDRDNAIFPSLPLAFEVNRGQADGQVRFLAHGTGYMLFLTATGATVSLPTSSALPFRGLPGTDRRRGAGRDSQGPAGTGAAVVQLRFAGGDPDARVVGLNRLPGEVNYLIGHDPRGWRTAIPTYARVAYRNVYPGVSIVYHGTPRRLEYDVVAAPGATVDRVQLDVDGAKRLQLDAAGALTLQTAAGLVVVAAKPLVYQEVDGHRRTVTGRYVLTGQHRVSFRIGRHAPARPLTIAPVLDTRPSGVPDINQGRSSGTLDARLHAPPGLDDATYLGGSNLEDGLGLAVDPAGDTFVTGQTGSTDFPTRRAVQAMHGPGVSRVFVSKLNPTGTALLYSTYLGGSNYDSGQSIAVDHAGRAYVTGYTDSSDFPTRHALQRHSGGSYDAFVLELNRRGDGLVYSTYLGGRGADGGFGVAADRAGNTYVAGATRSSDFPVRHALQARRSSSTLANAFLAKLTPEGRTLVYSTVLGGSNGGEGNSVAVDTAGDAYFYGDSLSHDFPLKNALQPTYAGGRTDTVVVKLNPKGRLLFSTYLGGNGFDRGQAIAVDNHRNVYVTGETTSTNFPTTAGAIQRRYGGGRDDSFVAKLDASGQHLIYSTYIGGRGVDTPYAIVSDRRGRAYVVGITGSPNFPTVHALEPAKRGNRDAYVCVLDPTGRNLTFSTYIGGDANTFGAGIGLDSQGNVYIAGQTNSTNLATTGVFQRREGGSYDAFSGKIDVRTVLKRKSSSPRLLFNVIRSPDKPTSEPRRGVGETGATTPYNSPRMRARAIVLWRSISGGRSMSRSWPSRTRTRPLTMLTSTSRGWHISSAPRGS